MGWAVCRWFIPGSDGQKLYILDADIGAYQSIAYSDAEVAIENNL